MSSHLNMYLQRFGVSAGAALYLRTKLRRGLLEVRLPGMAHPLYLRGGTSDRSAFNEVFVKRWYDHPYPAGQAPRFIIDAGANVGFASVRLAQLYPAAVIVAVEPDATNFEILQRNITPYPQIQAVRAGLWPRTARLAIENPHDKPWSFRVREAVTGDRDVMAAVSIQDLMRQHGAMTLDLLKLDVEGAELELLSDADCHAWLARTNMIFIELHDDFKPGCEAALHRALTGQEFNRVLFGSNWVLTRPQLLGSA
ncbi:MAG: FkbM family methyltransferase [Gammaproteobacteria bacterium]|nr:FkbM family methyltransferase [Gammaproteobacteria bacterium]